MKWHKVEDYPVGSDECVLVSCKVSNKRNSKWCYVAIMNEYGVWDDGVGNNYPAQFTDRWCYIDLPEE